MTKSTPSQFRQAVDRLIRDGDTDWAASQIEALHLKKVEEAKLETIKDALKAIKKYYSFEGDTDWEQIHWQDFKGILEGVLSKSIDRSKSNAKPN